MSAVPRSSILRRTFACPRAFWNAWFGMLGVPVNLRHYRRHGYFSSCSSAAPLHQLAKSNSMSDPSRAPDVVISLPVPEDTRFFLRSLPRHVTQDLLHTLTDRISASLTVRALMQISIGLLVVTIRHRHFYAARPHQHRFLPRLITQVTQWSLHTLIITTRILGPRLQPCSEFPATTGFFKSRLT